MKRPVLLGIGYAGDHHFLFLDRDPDSGNQLLADTDYIVTGTVRSIRKVTRNVADVYYLITLELVNPQAGEIVWADEKEIRKTSNNPRVGW